MNMLNNICAGADAYGIPLIASFHLDIEPLTVAPWTQKSSQFPIHILVYPSNPYASDLETGVLGEILSKGLYQSR